MDAEMIDALIRLYGLPGASVMLFVVMAIRQLRAGKDKSPDVVGDLISRLDDIKSQAASTNSKIERIEDQLRDVRERMAHMEGRLE